MHAYFEAFDSYFPNAGIEYYYYDQLGSAYSDQPDEPTLWDVPRFVEEVEQVRKALKLDKSNFYLYGQSWGGVLALEYALKYQQNLKALVISNMVASIPAYNRYADRQVGAEGPLPVLSEWQPPGPLRRSTVLHGGPDPVHSRCGRKSLLMHGC
jgi:proline iminopeptidase